jgi:hypothetical protein
MENPIIEHTRLDNVVKEIGKEENFLVEQAKQSNFVYKLAEDLSSTILGSSKNYAVDCCRLIISSFSPPLVISNPNTKVNRVVRGTENHLLLGPPSSSKSSWFNIMKNQGLNVISTQLLTPGGLTGTPLDLGITEYLKNSLWLIPEAESVLSNNHVINILRSLTEEQEIGKSSAGVISRTRFLKVHTSVCISLFSLPKQSKEFQFISRFYLNKVGVKNLEELQEIGQGLTEMLMVKQENLDNDFEPEPKHYFGLIANKITNMGLNDGRFHCFIDNNLKRELFNTWFNLVNKYYTNTRIFLDISLRDLVDGFRACQNFGLLNFFQRDIVKDNNYNYLVLNESDLNHGLEFMEKVMRTRSSFNVDEMKETSKVRLNLRKLIQVYELSNQGLTVREISNRVGLSKSTVSYYLKQLKGGYDEETQTC